MVTFSDFQNFSFSAIKKNIKINKSKFYHKLEDEEQ